MQITLEREILPDPILVSENQTVHNSLNGVMNNHYSNIEMDTVKVRSYSELHRLQDELDIMLNELRLIAQRMARTEFVE